MSRIIDLSHTVEHGMITYKGLPAPLVCDFWTRGSSSQHYTDGSSFYIGKIELVGNTGTYVDAPFHRYADGMDLSELPLECLAELEGVVVRAVVGQVAIGAESFKRVAVRGKAVLVHTGWSRHWGTDQYFEGHPFLTEDAARYLQTQGAVFVGIDSLNIDDTAGGRRPVHSLLLRVGIPICEHLCNLEQLPDSGFRLHSAAVKVRSFGSFPVRAYAVVS
ncbi:MAG: cyclase family protein [Gammaproteobacteria bacterium]|nr:cyclase family protein [Gammaproteobacteria bacterium]